MAHIATNVRYARDVVQFGEGCTPSPSKTGDLVKPLYEEYKLTQSNGWF